MIAFALSGTAFLNDKVEVDPQSATELLQDMGRPGGAADGAAGGAPAAGTDQPAWAARDEADPTKDVQRALQEEEKGQ